MPPTTTMIPTFRACAFRPRAIRSSNAVIGIKRPAYRCFADDKMPAAGEGNMGPNMGQQEHVSEEAAKMAEIQGKDGPDIEGQGTPVQDVSRPYQEGYIEKAMLILATLRSFETTRRHASKHRK